MTARDLPNYRATTAKFPTKSDRHELRGSRNFFSKKILNQPREKKRNAFALPVLQSKTMGLTPHRRKPDTVGESNQEKTKRNIKQVN